MVVLIKVYPKNSGYKRETYMDLPVLVYKRFLLNLYVRNSKRIGLNAGLKDAI